MLPMCTAFYAFDGASVELQPFIIKRWQMQCHVVVGLFPPAGINL